MIIPLNKESRYNVPKYLREAKQNYITIDIATGNSSDNFNEYEFGTQINDNIFSFMSDENDDKINTDIYYYKQQRYKEGDTMAENVAPGDEVKLSDLYILSQICRCAKYNGNSIDNSVS